jgi:hypothetical protein
VKELELVGNARFAQRSACRNETDVSSTLSKTHVKSRRRNTSLRLLPTLFGFPAKQATTLQVASGKIDTDTTLLPS